MTKECLAPEFLHECLVYDEDTGLLTWKERPRHHFGSDRDWRWWNKRFADTPAFRRFDRDGYLCGCIKNTPYRAHRVIWTMFTGKWPAELMDHKDGNRANNRMDNLREATNTENQRNRRLCGNEAGFKGVYLNNPDYRNSTYRAMIMVKAKHVYLGTFDTAEQAHAAYCAAAEKYFGEFARAA